MLKWNDPVKREVFRARMDLDELGSDSHLIWIRLRSSRLFCMGFILHGFLYELEPTCEFVVVALFDHQNALRLCLSILGSELVWGNSLTLSFAELRPEPNAPTTSIHNE